MGLLDPAALECIDKRSSVCIGRDFGACKFGKGRHHIPESDNLIAGLARRNHSGPASDKRYTYPPFGEIAFEAAQWAAGIELSGYAVVPAVVAGENDECIVGKAKFLDQCHDPADITIEPIDHGRILLRFLIPVLVGVRRSGWDGQTVWILAPRRKMRQCIGRIEEEWFVFVFSYVFQRAFGH